VYAQSQFGRNLQADEGGPPPTGSWSTALGAKTADDGSEIFSAYSNAGTGGGFAPGDVGCLFRLLWLFRLSQ
jgi:hypothetical protein